MRARPGALQVGSFRGVPIRVHFTLLLALPLLAFSFGGAFQQAASAADVPPESLGGHHLVWGLGVAVGGVVARAAAGGRVGRGRDEGEHPHAAEEAVRRRAGLGPGRDA